LSAIGTKQTWRLADVRLGKKRPTLQLHPKAPWLPWVRRIEAFGEKEEAPPGGEQGL